MKEGKKLLAKAYYQISKRIFEGGELPNDFQFRTDLEAEQFSNVFKFVTEHIGDLEPEATEIELTILGHSLLIMKKPEITHEDLNLNYEEDASE